MPSPLRLTAVLLVNLLAVQVADATAQDVLTIDNGDRMTGRVKRLERGQLVFDTPYSDGDIYVEWRRIKTIESRRIFQFKINDGVRFLGRILPETAPELGTLVVESGGNTRSFRRDDIVLVVETVGELSGFLETRVAAGLALSRGNDYKQVSASASANYESTGYTVSASVDSLFSTQRQSSNTNRHSAGLRFTKNVGRRWGLSVVNNYLHSEEQSLDLRTVLGGGPSRTFIRNGRFELEGIGGVVWNNERFDATVGKGTNDELEALAGVDFSFFQFRQWELDSTFLVFPSITTPGRVRSTLQADLRLRLIRGQSLWWNLSQVLDLDSDPRQVPRARIMSPRRR